MAIIYTCKHCRQCVGKLEKHEVDVTMLGVHALTESEQQEMIEHKDNGEIHIQTICDSCESALSAHPHYHELEHFIH